jgi:hypothetical protein
MIRRLVALASALTFIVLANPVSADVNFKVVDSNEKLMVTVSGVPPQCGSGCQYTYVLSPPSANHASWSLLAGNCARWPDGDWTCDDHPTAPNAVVTGPEVPTPPPYDYKLCVHQLAGFTHGNPHLGTLVGCVDLKQY